MAEENLTKDLDRLGDIAEPDSEMYRFDMLHRSQRDGSLMVDNEGRIAIFYYFNESYKSDYWSPEDLLHRGFVTCVLRKSSVKDPKTCYATDEYVKAMNSLHNHNSQLSKRPRLEEDTRGGSGHPSSASSSFMGASSSSGSPSTSTGPQGMMASPWHSVPSTSHVNGNPLAAASVAAFPSGAGVNPPWPSAFGASSGPFQFGQGKVGNGSGGFAVNPSLANLYSPTGQYLGPNALAMSAQHGQGPALPSTGSGGNRGQVGTLSTRQFHGRVKNQRANARAAREPKAPCSFEVELICLRYASQGVAVRNIDALTNLRRWGMGSKTITIPPGCDGVSLDNLLYATFPALRHAFQNGRIGFYYATRRGGASLNLEKVLIYSITTGEQLKQISRTSAGPRPVYVVPLFDLEEQPYTEEQLAAEPQQMCTTCNVSFPVTDYILHVQQEHGNGNDQAEDE